MPPAIIPDFAHRYRSGGIDLICSQCFIKVVTVQTEANLEPFGENMSVTR